MIFKMETAVFMFLTAVVGIFTFWFYQFEKLRRKLDKLGGPPTLPIIGNLHQFKRSPREFTAWLFEMMVQYGHLGVARIMLGNYPMIIILRPEFAEPIMTSTKHINKSRDYAYLHPWLATGLLTSTGEKWKVRRRLLTPTFHFKILHDFVFVMNKQSRIMREKIMKRADGKPYNIFSDITLCALDIICETAMGRSVNAQGNKDSEYVTAVYKASEYVFMRQRTPWFWPDILFKLLGPGWEMDRCLKVLHGFTEKVIAERQEEFIRKHDNTVTMETLLAQTDALGRKQRLAFLDMLLCASADGNKLSIRDIREEVDTFMFEGHDTTAMASNWAIHLIGANPEAQEKIQEELDGIFAGDIDRDATMDDLKDMNYLECCIKETLRIFPSVPFFGRSLTEPMTLGGVQLDEGATIIVAPAALHRDERFFPNPETFDPDRFLPENTVDRHPYAYIPFSAGSRNCIGQKFAMLEMKTVLSTIFRNFNVKSLQAREELYPTAELILRPENGIVVEVVPRQQA